MRKDLEDRFTMFYATQTAVDAHNAAWAALLPFANAVTAFKDKIVAIEAEIAKQTTDLEGYALDKGEKKEKMIRKGLEIANKVYAFAVDDGNTVLREKMDVSYSDLAAPRYAVIAQKCQVIHDEANAVAASIVAYGVAAGDLTDLQTLIDDYEAVISAPRTAITVRKGAMEAIEALIKEGTTILTTRMDKLMSEFELTKPDFYQEYFDARIVVNTGAKGGDEPPAPPEP
ncbi:MAG: hypothetical protein IPF41_15010 [Flavobacteriales bacterium]|nr:hypothetical protein [Flavobacteriales bacterium]